MASRFEVRETREEDVPALNDLYLRLTGLQRSFEQWAWEWRDGPFGLAPSWVIVDADINAVVAHHGVVPIALRMPDGTVIKACRTENTMVDPHYRKRLNYVAYEARLLKTITRDYSAVFTTTGKGAPGAVRQRFGYRPVGTWRAVPVLAHPFYRPAMLLPPSVTCFTPRFGGRAGEWTAEITSDIERVSNVCSRPTGVAITVERSAAFLRWRFVEHPYHRYHMAILRRGGEDAGYLVWKYKRRGGALDVIIDDIVLSGEGANRMKAALRAVRRVLPGQPSRFILRSLDSGGTLSDLIRMERPKPADGEETKLLVYWSDGRDIAPWDVTPILTQGI